jgi:hypothetical protein
MNEHVDVNTATYEADEEDEVEETEEEDDEEDTSEEDEETPIQQQRGMNEENLTCEDERFRNCKVIVEDAGTADVNGEYHFVTFQRVVIRIGHITSLFQRFGTYMGIPNHRFTLYKCLLRIGSYQWFISITPHDQDPGTDRDIDLYFAYADWKEILPPVKWRVIGAASTPRQTSFGLRPAPRVTCDPLHIIIVEGAGAADVNGDYHFVSFRESDGGSIRFLFQRFGSYLGTPNQRFTLRKSYLGEGEFQWILSLTPHDQDPSSDQDIDFYFSQATEKDFLPPRNWYPACGFDAGLDPAPQVTCIPCRHPDRPRPNLVEQMIGPILPGI